MSEPVHQPPSAPPQATEAQTRDSIIKAYSEGASQFHSYEYHDAIGTYRWLLHQKQDFVSETLLLFNIGVSRDHLGEHALAAEAYQKAIDLDKSFSIGWFSLGTATFLLGNYEKAMKAFRTCLKTLKGDSMDYHERGLNWTLANTTVAFNENHSTFLALRKEKGETSFIPWFLNRLPAGIIFESTIPAGEEDTKPPLSLHEASSVEPAEPQASAEEPQSIAPRRSATARVTTNLRKKMPFSSKLGRSATTPQNWGKQSFDDRHQTVKPPDSQRETDIQPLVIRTRRGNARGHSRMDSHGIFAQGEQEQLKLQANATEASIKALQRSRSLSHRHHADKGAEAS
ncbi:MAG: hypothetical protein M1840_004268 [Geoglossum simile]|nr:MAG: hypothetical protein M1840_004268 [Geoglossum simile]